eukprot:scaffold3966_cov126-Isochrysis_galbana.AAC.1
MGRERGGVTGRHRTEVSRLAAVSVSRTLNTLAQAVVVHAALTPSPAYSGQNKRKTGWGKNGAGEGEGECPDGRRTEVSSRDSRVAAMIGDRTHGLTPALAPRPSIYHMCGAAAAEGGGAGARGIDGAIRAREAR